MDCTTRVYGSYLKTREAIEKVFDCSRCNANIEYRRETSKTFVVVFWKFAPVHSLEKLIDDCNDSLYLALSVNP